MTAFQVRQRLVRGAAAALALLALAASPALAQPAPEAKQPKKKDRRGLIWDDTRPSIVFGKDINIDFRFKIQMDWRRFDPEVGVGDVDFPGTFDIETKRSMRVTELSISSQGVQAWREGVPCEGGLDERTPNDLRQGVC